MAETEELPEGEEFRDEEFPEGTGDEGSETLSCPRCGSSIYTETVRCPHCGDYVTPGARPAEGGLPWWFWLGVILAGAALLAWVTKGL